MNELFSSHVVFLFPCLPENSCSGREREREIGAKCFTRRALAYYWDCANRHKPARIVRRERHLREHSKRRWLHFFGKTKPHRTAKKIKRKGSRLVETNSESGLADQTLSSSFSLSRLLLHLILWNFLLKNCRFLHEIPVGLTSNKPHRLYGLRVWALEPMNDLQVFRMIDVSSIRDRKDDNGTKPVRESSRLPFHCTAGYFMEFVSFYLVKIDS